MRDRRAAEQITSRAIAGACFLAFFAFVLVAAGFFLVIATSSLTIFAFGHLILLVYEALMSVSKLGKGTKPFKPTKQQLIEAAGQTLPDVIGPGLRLLFCGINPGLFTAAVGHHFARPGNRFWPALYKSGFTDRFLSPFEEHELLKLSLGITNIVAHATATAAELTREDIVKGSGALITKVRRFRPRVLAILGVGAYRYAFAQPKATIGEQDERIGDTRVWVLPNPSGLNANYQLPDLVRLFSELREAAGA